MTVITRLTNRENRKGPSVRLRSISCAVFALVLVVVSSAYAQQSAGVLLQSGLYKEEVSGDLEAAIGIYERILKDFPQDRPVAAKALLHIGLCYEKLGFKQAQEAFQNVVDNFPDQKEVFEAAKERLSRIVKAKAVLEEGAKEFTLRKIRSGPEQGKISPDGRHLVYTDWETGDLAVLEIATGNKRRITNKGPWTESSEFALFSSWSPDGRQVGYDWYDESNNPQIRITGIDDAEPRILWRDETRGTAIYYSWSPDGKYILALLFKSAKPSQIVLISVSDGSDRILKDLDLRNLAVNQIISMGFSPDGRYIVYDRPADNNSPNRDIFALSITDKLEIPLVQHPANDTLLGWVPDGRYVLFARNTDGIDAIWLLAVEGGKPKGAPRLIRKGMGEIQPQGFTRDGSFYYVTSAPYTPGVYTAKLDPKTGKVVTQAKELIEHLARAALSPVYSPDGKYLAYVSLRGPGVNGLCIRSLETGREQLFPKLLGFTNLRWSQDGQSILAITSDSRGRQGHNVICKIDTETGGVTTVLRCEDTRMNQTVNSVDWSLDGKAIFYVLNDRARRLCQLLVRDLNSGKEKELYRAPSWAQRFSMSRSPDGKWLALNNYRGHAQKEIVLKVIPAAGGEPRELFSFETKTNWRFNTAWTADSRFILLPKSEPGAVELWRISAEDGKAQKTGLKMNRIWNLSTHPDGQSVVFQARQAEPEKELWVMENFLPETPVARPEPTTTLRKLEEHWGGFANISPDGKYLSDVDWGSGDLVVRELATGEQRSVTKKGSWQDSTEYALDSAISPDSKQIAYLWYDPDSYTPISSLHTVGLDGSGQRLLCKGKYAIPRDWSADGSKILTILLEKTKQMVWVSAPDGSIQKIKSVGEAYPGKFDVSPDGRFIAYDLPQADNTSDRDVFLYDLAESREIHLIEHSANDRLLGWTPNGRSIFFASDRAGSWDGWLLEVHAGKPAGAPQLARAHIGNIQPVGFGSNGSYYYAIYDIRSNVYTASFDLDTGEILSPLKPVRHTGRLPDWSSDGKYLAYCCAKGKDDESPVIRIRSFATDQERVIDPKLPPFFTMNWAPDGNSLLVSGFRGDHGLPQVIYKVDVHTGEHAELVRSETTQILYAKWLPDGKRLLYRHRHGSPHMRTDDSMTTSLVIRDTDTGDEREVFRTEYPHDHFQRDWALSPDGRQIVVRVEGKNSGVKIISVDGEERRELLGRDWAKKISRVVWSVWSPDGNNILLLVAVDKESKPPATELWRVAAEGGEPEKLQTFKQVQLSKMRIHPSGDHIALSAHEALYEMWVMENFLPESTAGK